MRKLFKPKVTENFQGPKPKRSKTWEHLPLYDSKINSQFEVCLLNYTKKLDLPADWNNEFPNKLWVYNLHYFEDLLSKNAEEKHNFHLQLLNNWVDQNLVGYGNGWEPYPTSLRIVNILKAWLGGLNLDEKLFNSIFAQASFLSSDLEKHLLGNHYFVNLKALLFVGVIFENTRWLKIAEKGLMSEIPEQILEDGGNFELSPMYHSLILVDMLDLCNLSRSYPSRVSNDLKSLLEERIPKMLTYMEVMSHPDGGVSFFNDSVDGISPEKQIIEKYAKNLGFKASHLNIYKTQIIDNSCSGYFSATAAGKKLIFDASSVGAEYIPGHAHADTLSFELSIRNERVIVNTGTSEYGLGKNRIQQRKTSSHNTVEVDGRDSSEVWSGFRVAKRAHITERYSEITLDKNIILKATHNGYKSNFGGCYHSRKLNFNGLSLIINDKLKGKFSEAKLRFYFHPDLNITLEKEVLTVTGVTFKLTSELKNQKASLLDKIWYPGFGLEIPNKMLLIEFLDNETEIIFEWTEKPNIV